MKKIITILAFCTGMAGSFAQVGINADGSGPSGSAMLDVKSNSMGMLVPRMTSSQIAGIQYPSNGLIVYCTTDDKLYVYVSSSLVWKEIQYGSNTIVPGFVCGQNITVNHTAGPVAPVTKTVTYGTVTGITGEPSKCWITRNLGASAQAAAANDPTEAAAGWYWQFNLKQGYQHDGTTRTPNTPWLYPVDENSDWLPANDPCTLEIGTGWRIPTYTEWYNVDNAGGWIDWSGPWYALVMHTAGFLDYTTGVLYWRYSDGYYWGSTQQSSVFSGYLYFGVGHCFMDTTYKSYGFSIRCLRE